MNASNEGRRAQIVCDCCRRPPSFSSLLGNHTDQNICMLIQQNVVPPSRERLWQRPNKGESELNLKKLDRFFFFFFLNFTYFNGKTTCTPLEKNF